MITLRLIFISLLLISLSCFAEYKIPRSVFMLSELDEALEKAEKFDKSLTFMISNPESTCGLCHNACDEIIKQMKSTTVVIFTPNTSKYPAELKALVSGKDRGKYIPFAFVVDRDYSKLHGILKYQNVKNEGRKAFKAVKKSIKEY